jgi:hypothetical protein
MVKVLMTIHYSPRTSTCDEDFLKYALKCRINLKLWKTGSLFSWNKMKADSNIECVATL